MLTQLICQLKERKNKEAQIDKARTFGVNVNNHGNCDYMKHKIDFYQNRYSKIRPDMSLSMQGDALNSG